jgi:DnaK suppressor protein
MTRNDALHKLYERLIAKRDSLRELLGIGPCDHDAEVGDSADAASDEISMEMSSQIASIETDELHSIEHALDMLRAGRYGECEDCGAQIPIARLQALPYTATCVKCQEFEEKNGYRRSEDANWENACNYEGRLNDEDVVPEKMRFKFDE